jgi:hypothetical protein
MPSYNSTPGNNVPTALALEGQLNYAFGSKPQSPTTQLQITKTAAAGGTVTLNVNVVAGNTPLVGQLITVTGTTQNSGNFNVTNVPITGVSLNNKGVGTVTFAGAGSVASAADAGMAYVPAAYSFESMTAASQAFAMPRTAGPNDNAMTVNWETVYQTAPGAIQVALQVANDDTDSSYQTIDTTTNVNGDVRFYSGVAARFLRFKVIAGSATGAVIFWL